MIIKIGLFKKDGIVPFFLAKNPNAKPDENGFIYSRNSNQYGNVFGKYVKSKIETDKLYFQLHNEKSGLVFLEWARKQNMDNYNFIHRDAVSPTNLKIFDIAYRDIVQGNLSKKLTAKDIEGVVEIRDISINAKTAEESLVKITPEQFIQEEINRPRYLEAEISPFFLKTERDLKKIRDSFWAYGISVTLAQYEDVKYAYTVNLLAKMPIEEFFQKIYLISFYNTIGLDIQDFSSKRISQQVERFANIISVNWLKNYKDNYSFVIDEIGLEKIAQKSFLQQNQKDALKKHKGKTFKTAVEFKSFIKDFLTDYDLNNLVKNQSAIKELQKIFYYKKVINRIIDSLARHSNKFKEKFKLLLAEDEQQREAIKVEYDVTKYGGLHRTKHSLVIDEILESTTVYKFHPTRTINAVTNKESYSHPFNYLTDAIRDYLSAVSFSSKAEMKNHVYFVMKKTFKYRIANYRHRLDDKLIESFIPVVNKKAKIVDYGCGVDMKLSKTLKKKGFKNVYAFDTSNKTNNRNKHYGSFNQMNILYPRLDEKLINPDILLSIEVIEHLEKADRIKMIKIIRDVICPGKFVLTTPNIDYNQFYESLNDGEYRHKDHKIEYTLEEFHGEVIKPLQEAYDVQLIGIEPEKDIQQSFMIICERKRSTFNKNFKAGLNLYYDSIYLPYSGYAIGKKELQNGYASKVFQMNRKNIFFSGTTIAPVDYTNKAPDYLEHPLSAIDYYEDRGITDLFVQKKYMGSRVYILAFKNIEIAKKLGFNDLIVINSRGNYPFFENVKLKPDSPILARVTKKVKATFTLTDEGYVHWKDLDMLIYNDIKKKLTHDAMLFDGEAMPWSIKGQYLINNEFRAPAEMTLVKNRLTGKDTSNVEKFIQVLDTFGKQTRLEIRLFGMVAALDVKDYMKKHRKKGLVKTHKIHNIINGFNVPRNKEYKAIRHFYGRFVKPVEGFRVDTKSKESIDRFVTEWTKYVTTEKGEGFVVKTNQPVIVQTNGHLITPMLKVRGTEYLRIIYGIDMYEPDYFERLKKRSIKAKRILSVHQTEISIGMLNAFLRGHVDTKNRYLAGFMGIENLNFNNIDKTL